MVSLISRSDVQHLPGPFKFCLISDHWLQADISTKSANYCAPSLSGNHGLLLLCEAELGDPMYEIIEADYEAGEEAKKKGCIATMGIGQTVPQGWIDAGVVHKDLKGVIMVRVDLRSSRY